MFTSEDYLMLPEEIRHEMKSIGCLVNTLLKQERKSKNQTLIRKTFQRCLDVIDKLSNKKLEIFKDEKNDDCSNDGITERMFNGGNTD